MGSTFGPGLRRRNCTCGLCCVRLTTEALGELHPAVFKRFLGQALRVSKTQVHTDSGCSFVKTGLSWINCRGAIQSLAFDVIGRGVPREAQLVTNMVAVLELCFHYIDARNTVLDQRTEPWLPALQNDWSILCRQSVQQAITAVRDSGCRSPKQLLGLVTMTTLASKMSKQ